MQERKREKRTLHSFPQRTDFDRFQAEGGNKMARKDSWPTHLNLPSDTTRVAAGMMPMEENGLPANIGYESS